MLKHLSLIFDDEAPEARLPRFRALLRLARVAEHGDDHTGEHTRRVGRTAEALARVLDLDETLAVSIGLAAPLHDIGKIGIPNAILSSTDPLDAD